jgi:hypothetical protein
LQKLNDFLDDRFSPLATHMRWYINILLFSIVIKIVSRCRLYE